MKDPILEEVKKSIKEQTGVDEKPISNHIAVLWNMLNIWKEVYNIYIYI